MVSEQENCKFCNESVKHYISNCNGNGKIECNTCIYDDKYCYAILSDEPYTEGHTIVILKRPKHKTDITDEVLEDELSKFIHTIHKVSVHLKKTAPRRDADAKERPERIYVCMLGDGIKHLHAHLIPRYPFTKKDKKIYRKIFTPRDSALKVSEAIISCEIGGFWYIAEREKNCKFRNKPKEEKKAYLENLANELRLT